MRWALAWSFYDDVIVPSPPSKKCKLEKARKPLSFTLPEAGLKELQAKATALGYTGCSPVDGVTALLEKTLTDLRVLHKRVPCRKQEQSLFITAIENTWIHGRQKRREQKRQLRELPRAPPTVVTPVPATATATPTQNQTPSTQNSGTNDTKKSACGQQQPVEMGDESNTGGQHKEAGETAAGVDVVMECVCTEASAAGQETSPKEATSAENELPAKQTLSLAVVEHFLFKCLLNVMLEEKDVMIEMHWVEGQNKDLMNQLCTYLKNTLLKCVAK